MSPEVIARRSAKPGGTGKVEISITRKRSRVTGAPVLLTIRRRMSNVPRVEVAALPGVKSRTRVGAAPLVAGASSKNPGSVELRWIGDDKFSGPGAPNR